MILGWIGDLCIKTLDIMCRSDIPIILVFIFTDDSINASMICSTSSSSRMLRDAIGVRVDAGIPLFWFLLECTRYMPESID